jgi:predicted lipoprotein with Yx(FWY)xxD motif
MERLRTTIRGRRELLLSVTVTLALVLGACSAGGYGQPSDQDKQAPPASIDGQQDQAQASTDATGGQSGDAYGQDAYGGDAYGQGDGAGSAAAGALTLAATSLGQVLADGDGRVLYAFTNDQGGVSSCYDDCAANWPPLLADAQPTVEGDLDPSLLGTTQRDDGTAQVTYNNRPLYYFAADKQPGQTNGQAIGESWWVLDATGELVKG